MTASISLRIRLSGILQKNCEMLLLRHKNREVRRIFVQQVMAWFKEKSASNTEKLSELYAAFKTGDAETVENLLNKQLLDRISYHDAYESFYHGTAA